jgi:primosomal protein N' (replication factor Y)
VSRRLGREIARRAIRSLVRSGLVLRGSELPAPRARPKRVNFVRLVASPPQVEAVRPYLGHASKQADILLELLEWSEPLPTRDDILAAAEATMSPMAALVDKGLVELVPAQTFALLAPEAQAEDLSRAPKQRAIVEQLRTQDEPVERQALLERSDASSGSLRALAKRGLVQLVVQPDAVLLRVGVDAARQRIVELRGAKRQHDVLDYLLRQPPGKQIWVSWVYAETGASLDDLRAVEAHGLVALSEAEMWRDPLADHTFVLERAPRLTPDQARAWAAIRPAVEGTDRVGAPRAFLLHGVTGSGKTEVYMRAVEATLARGRQAVVLVPEISMTPQTVQRFSARFPSGLGITHSALSDGERFDTWRRVRAGQIQLVIGPRSALYAPLADIGLIVLDEEHDASYKQDDVMPTYHARRVAMRLAEMHDATVILGSATPDVVTYDRSSKDVHMELVQLAQRLLSPRQHVQEQLARFGEAIGGYHPLGPGYEDVYAAELPPVRVVDMRHELRAGNRSMFSRPLQHALARVLDRNEQAILFLNRRGASTFVLCRDCGSVVRCPNCDIPLTYHRAGEHMTCHHCGHQQQAPTTCAQCGSHRIRHFGVGTERVESALRELHPSVRTVRWDRDTTRRRGSHNALLDRFARHRADVLIGTQMIAKGLDLPLVTLVGVISADTALNLPDFRAAERTFQLLEQVSGRAGRGPRGGQVIVQTYSPDHYAIRAAAEHDYAAFYAREHAFRLQQRYPPRARLARLLYRDSDLVRCRQRVTDVRTRLEDSIAASAPAHLDAIGPAPAFFSRLRGRWRWQIILRADEPQVLQALLQTLDLPPGWHVDVDPLDVL